MGETNAEAKEFERAIWICRHGNRIDFLPDQAADRKRRRQYGPDPYLSEDGVQQARETGERLRGEEIQHICCSPFLRTVETAHHIAEILDLPIWIEWGACEWLNPRWFARAPELATAQERAERFPRVDPAYTSLVIPNHPETAEEAFVRAGQAARLLAQTYGGNLLLVGHGHSVVGMSWGLLEDRPKIHAGLCALVQIGRCDGTWRLNLNGDTSHLSSGEQARDRFD
jgi:broad specificity phosphatase PhoE